jgi:dTDP-4-amino-4,6-dideoxygalactose transaminase
VTGVEKGRNLMIAKSPIPVLVPHLPDADQILPYLRRVDASRIYSNYGPLSREFVSALASRFATHGGEVGVTLTCNGTSAIELALRTRARPALRYCIMPSYTFIASAHAVTNAGLEPFLVDVDERNLALTPSIAVQAMRRMPAPPAAVLVISPFGAPPDLPAWEAFERETGVPVVFAAAAAAASIKTSGYQPQCVSLHATKVLGIGEGGAIICSDPDLIAKTTAMTGFGFGGAERVSIMRGGNYRVSEYAAVVGLAALDNLETTVGRLRELTATYAAELRNLDVRLQDGVGTEWVTMTLNVILPDHRASAAKAKLDAAEIGWRHWWGMGCHTHPAFADLPAADLSVTNELAPRVIGIPFHDRLTQDQIGAVCDCLR